MPDYAELEFSLFPRDPDSYSIDIRYNDPQDQASHTPVRGVVRLDLAALRALRLDPAAYGKALSDSLFADPTVRSYYDQARAATQSQNKTLRLRLFLDPSLPALYDVRWETLRDPGDGSWLLTSENLLFTRFLSSNSWEQVQLRPKSDLKALLLVANPQDLADGKYQVDGQTLAPIDVPGEIERAKQNLTPITADILASDPAKPGQASLSRLADAFRQSYDILYVVCHGALLSKEPAGAYLWLEGDDGKTSLTPASALVDRLRDLPASARPRLVVLASCQSAGQAGVMRTSDAQGALAALGPQLAQAGIPAVLAMQGDISMDTVASFMPVFFRELVRDGQVDRAAAAARSAVRERADAWIPVLFLRLRGGRIWYVPGFGEDRADFEKWPALLRSISRSQCTPILGPGLYENILGTQRELSVRWAEAYHYPLEIHERESLPQVAQFLTVNQYEQAPFDELEEYLTQTIRSRFKDIIKNGNQPTLDQLFDQVGTHLRQEDPADPYKVLAGLPIPVFITTNANNLLAGALKEVGKDPQVVLCPWNDSVEQMGSIYDKEPDYQPTPDRPLIYHMFGRLDEPDSIVLTEDNYFDFLIGVTRNKDLVPGAVRRALADTSLLFLGFQMDDWQFRVLFRSILAQQGGERRSRYPHIAAQLEPDENRIPEPDRARRYLENYFFQGANISLFWGSVDDFMSELTTRLPQRAP